MKACFEDPMLVQLKDDPMVLWIVVCVLAFVIFNLATRSRLR